MNVLGYAAVAAAASGVLLLIGGGVIPLWPYDPAEDEPPEEVDDHAGRHARR